MQNLMTDLTGALPTSLSDSEAKLTELLQTMPLSRHRELKEEIESLGGRIFFDGGKQKVDFDPMRLLSRADVNSAHGSGAHLIRDIEAKLIETIGRYTQP